MNVKMFTLTPTGKIIHFNQEHSALPTIGRPGGTALGNPVIIQQLEGKFATAQGSGTTSMSGWDGVTARVQALLHLGLGNTSLFTLANDLKTQYEAHRVDLVAHSGADAANVVTAAIATDLATSMTLLNDIRAQYEAHRVVTPAVHPAADAINVVAAPAATDLATALALANDLKAKHEAHRVDLIAHVAADTTNVVTASNASVTNRSVVTFDGDAGYPLGTVTISADTFNRVYVEVKDRDGVLVGQTVPAGSPVNAGSSVDVRFSWNAVVPIDGTRYALLELNGTPISSAEWVAGTDPTSSWSAFQPSSMRLSGDVALVQVSKTA